MTTATRTATFAGLLGFGDYTITGFAAGPLKVAIDVRTGMALKGKTRSLRPFAITSGPWHYGEGRSIEDIGSRFAENLPPGDAEDVPGDALELWLLPVVSPVFEYLITPAGDWPPGEQP